MNIEKTTNLGYVIWEKIPTDCLHQYNPSGTDAFQAHVLDTIGELTKRQVQRIRLNVSWADWITPGGRECILWYLGAYAKAGFDIIPCLGHVPRELSQTGKVGGPPKKLEDFALFMYEFMLSVIADDIPFEYIEIWNEYTEGSDWSKSFDVDFQWFTRMIVPACIIARFFGKKTVLGGMADIHERSTNLFQTLVARELSHTFDVIGFHVLRGTWNDTDPLETIDGQAGLLADRMTAHSSECVERILDHKQTHTKRSGVLNQILLQGKKYLRSEMPEIWLTKYGFSTTNMGLERQIDQLRLQQIQTYLFADALKRQHHAPLGRVYWHTLRDSSERQEHAQRYFGDCYTDGKPKLLGKLLISGGPNLVLGYIDDDEIDMYLQAASVRRSTNPFGGHSGRRQELVQFAYS